MGLFDLTSTVLTRYKADVSDHKAKLRELSGAQKLQAQETIKHLETQNRGIEKQVATLGKIAVGIGVVTGAYMTLKKSMGDFQRHMQLTHAAAGINISQLQKASHGLLTEWQLMEFAAAGTTGVWKLNQKQLETVANWITVLRNEGKNLSDVFETMKKAIQSGGVEELQRLGIRIQNVKGQLARKGSEEGLNGLMAEAQKQMGRFVDIAGDDSIRASNNFANATKHMSTALGALAQSLAPVVDLLAKAVEGWARFGSGLRYGFGERGSILRTAVEGTGEAQMRADAALLQIRLDEAVTRHRMAWLRRNDELIEKEAREVIRLRRLLEWAKPGGSRWANYYAEQARNSPEVQAQYAQMGSYLPGGSAWATSGGAGAGRRGGGGPATGLPIPADYDYGAPGRGPGFQGTSWSPEIPAGRPAEMFGTGLSYAPQGRAAQGLRVGGDAWMQDKLQRALGSGTEAFQMFKSAGQQAFQAWISGSATMAQAFKQAMGAMIAAKASHMFATALEYGVLALVHWNPYYLAGAARAAAAGLALTAMARALGYGGQVVGGSGGGGGGAAHVTSGGGLSTTKGGSSVIVLSPDWAENKYSANARLKRAIAQAERQGGGGGTVDWN